MARFLTSAEYLPRAPHTPGTVRINHNTKECSGESKSLKITRHPDGSISAKCFRCGKFGKTGAVVDHKTLKFRYDKIKGHSVTLPVTPRMPSDSEADPYKWPIQARHWIQSYGITNTEIKAWGVCWSDYYDRLLFPIVASGLRGFLSRRIYSHDSGPKWLVHQPKGQPSLFFRARKEGVRTLVLVEDIVSAIKVHRHTSSMAICGVHLTPEMLAWIISNKFNRFFIWLDNDNHKVRVEQIKIRDRLAMFGDVTIVKTDRDPKEHSDEEIREVIL